MASLFTKIIRGEIPSFKIYEDEHTFAFLDINPVKPGHLLVVPKVEVDHHFEAEEKSYAAVFTAAKKIAPALRRATDAERICTTIIGFEVPHFHYHLIPCDMMADFNFKNARPASKEDLAIMQKKILAELR